MLRRRIRWSYIRWSWVVAALVTGAGWGALGFVVDGWVGMGTATFISMAAIAGIATVAID